MAKRIIMHAIMAKYLSILGYGRDDIMSMESRNMAKMMATSGKCRYDILIIMIAEAGVVMPIK